MTDYTFNILTDAFINLYCFITGLTIAFQIVHPSPNNKLSFRHLLIYTCIAIIWPVFFLIMFYIAYKEHKYQKWMNNRDEPEYVFNDLWIKHRNHGRGSIETGPNDPDCPCRETSQMLECAKTGCGFCLAHKSMLDKSNE